MKANPFDPTCWYYGIFHGFKTADQCIDQAMECVEMGAFSPLTLEIAGLFKSEQHRLLSIIFDSPEFDKSKTLSDYIDQFARDAIEGYLSDEISLDQLKQITTQMWLESERKSRGTLGSLYLFFVSMRMNSVLLSEENIKEKLADIL